MTLGTKVLNRVNGVNFGNIYCKSTALGNIKSSKPNFMTWQEYSVYLLESIGIYNKDLMLRYYRKIKKFMIWHKNKYQIDEENIPETADRKLENQKKAISWRRIARAIEKNDFYLKRLSFAPTKSDDTELKRLIHKWDNLLNSSTITDDKDLQNIEMEKEKILKLTNQSKGFYEYMGRFFGSRLVQNQINDRIYDDSNKVWYIYCINDKVVAFVSMVNETIKNLYGVKDEYLKTLLDNIKKEVKIDISIVPIIYKEIYEKSGFTVGEEGNYKNFVTISMQGSVG